MKKTILMIMALAMGLSAAAETFNIVTVNRTDGVAEQLLLHEKMTMKVANGNILRITHPEITVEYEIPEVAQLSFGYDANAPLYTGDHEASLAETLAGSHIEITPEAIKCSDGQLIEAYDLNGRNVASAIGCLEVCKLPAPAIYIVKIGSTTLKIKR